MSDQPQPRAKKAANYKSRAWGLLIIVVLALAAWYYLSGGAGDLLRGVLSEDAVPEPSATPAQKAAQVVPDTRLVQRLDALETATLRLESAQEAQGELLASLDRFAQKADLNDSAARLREEIRAMRDSFPRTLELEHSQAALALRLLELAEIEHRLFGDSSALVSLIERVQALLRDHPLAMDIKVDLARLGEDIASSTTSDRLQLAESLQAMMREAAEVPLRPSRYEAGRSDAAGILDRVAAGLKSLVRVSRLDASDDGHVLNRVQLVLALERMQVALLRRDETALARERSFALDWLERHAQLEDARTQALLSEISALDMVDLGVQREEFASLIERVNGLVE